MHCRWVRMVGNAHLITSLQDDMRATEEARYRVRVRVEETLLDLGDTVSAPVDLHEFGELALLWCESKLAMDYTTRTLGSTTRTNAYCILVKCQRHNHVESSPPSRAPPSSSRVHPAFHTLVFSLMTTIRVLTSRPRTPPPAPPVPRSPCSAPSGHLCPSRT